MKGNELVWRTLLDGVFQGQERWANLADLAFKAGVPLATAHLATKKPQEIGALLSYRSGGLSVTNPEKLLRLFCAWRNIKADQIGTTTRVAFNELLQTIEKSAAWGGVDAAIHHLGGLQLTDQPKGIGYLRVEPGVETSLAPGDEVVVLSMDSRAAKDWDGFSSIGQTIADLFASPGWQASEYRYAMEAKFISNRNWERGAD